MTPEHSRILEPRRLISSAAWAILATLMLTAVGCEPKWPTLPEVFAEKQYTILLHTFSGPNHVRHSKLYRDQTKEMAGWSGLEVVHKESNSELYWGEYRSLAEAEDDLKTARTWRAPNVNRSAFPFPRVVLLPGHEVEIPEYNLLNVSEGHWTVLVAIYVDDPKQGFVGRERQRHALEYCSFLRKKGFKGYYHHVTGRSQVTVGVFPERAVVMETRPSLKSNLVIAKKVIKSDKMRKIMATAEPPLRFLVVNDHTEYTKRRNAKTGKIVKMIVSSHPMLIPRKPGFSTPVRRGGHEIEVNP